MLEKTVIPGRLEEECLPEKFALVLEGGGTRGCYTAGVLDVFLKENIRFPYVIGVSAGAGNALSYVSGQKERNKKMIQQHIHRVEYMSVRHMWKKKSYFNWSYILEEMPEKHLFFDWDVFHHSKVHFLTGAFDCEQGKTIWFKKDMIDKHSEVIKASASVPFVTEIVHFNGKNMLDGGILDPIPIEKSIRDGNEFHVIVLTQGKGYKKDPVDPRMAAIYYKKYPKISEALRDRHKTYERQVKLCEDLEKKGKAVIIRPEHSVNVGRMERNVNKLLHLYSLGEKDAMKLLNDCSRAEEIAASSEFRYFI